MSTPFQAFCKEADDRFILKRPLVFHKILYPLGDGMCMTFIKINPPPLDISNHDVPHYVGCSFGVFGEGVRVSGNNTIIPEHLLSVFGLP